MNEKPSSQIKELYKTTVYNKWKSIKQRCNDKNLPHYNLWGGRGITYDKKWVTFEGFYYDFGFTYKKGHSIDRINNNGNYTKENCRWATYKEQANNRRDNTLLTYKNITKTLAQWADSLGIKHSTLCMRLYNYNWGIEKSLTKAVNNYAKRKYNHWS